MKDNRGRTLEVGQEVVCNVSGQLGKGRIVRLKSNAAHRSTAVWVELLHTTAGMPAGHVTKVKSPLSVLVIHEQPMLPEPPDQQVMKLRAAVSVYFSSLKLVANHPEPGTPRHVEDRLAYRAAKRRLKEMAGCG